MRATTDVTTNVIGCLTHMHTTTIQRNCSMRSDQSIVALQNKPSLKCISNAFQVRNQNDISLLCRCVLYCELINGSNSHRVTYCDTSATHIAIKIFRCIDRDRIIVPPILDIAILIIMFIPYKLYSDKQWHIHTVYKILQYHNIYILQYDITTVRYSLYTIA